MSTAAAISSASGEVVVSAKNGCCGTAAPEEWQRTQFALAVFFTSVYSVELANSAAPGNLLLPPTSLMVGACSWIWVPPVAAAPAQLRIQTVSRSAQAEGACNQQL